MEIKKLLNEMDGEMESSPDQPGEDGYWDSKGSESFKVLINSDSAFKGRISKPQVVSFKYKDLASALSDASGLTVTRAKAKAMFDAFRRTMGL